MNARPPFEVRVVSHADEPLVQHLLTHTERPAIRNWHWWEHVGEETFLVTLSGGVPVGVLMACRDAGPVAWVRIAALASHVAVGEWLDLCLPRLIPPLRRQGTRRLGWLDVGGWAGAALRARWFQRETWLVTLGKGDHHLPHATAQDAHVRRAQPADIDALVRLDHAAFTPPWWLSRETLDHMRRKSACFLVAEQAGTCIGYAEAQMVRHYAHIGRMAVEPRLQGSGMGQFLLSKTLQHLWSLGAQHVSLNTQAENATSQKLYRRTGFQPFGERIGVWMRSV